MPSPFVKLILSIAIVVLSTIAATAQEAVTFRYRFEPGEKLTYDISTSVKQTQNLNGQALKSEFLVAQRVEREVAQIDADGRAVLNCRSQKFTVSMQIGPLGKYKFDAAKKDNDSSGRLGAAATPLYKAMSSADITLTLSPRGQVLAVKGLQEALADVLKNNPLTAQLAGGSSSNESAKASYAEHFLQFPEEARSPGDTWEFPLQLTIPDVGTVSGKTTCRYEGPQDVKGRTLHRVTATSDVTVDVDIDRDGVTATGRIEMTTRSHMQSSRSRSSRNVCLL